MNKLITKLMIATLLTTFGLASQAQEGAKKTPQQMTSKSAKDFSEKDKKAFVKAYKSVSRLQQQFRSKVSKDMDKKKMKKMARKVNKNIESKIDDVDNMDTGLYQEMLVALKSDKKLLKDIKGRLQN